MQTSKGICVGVFCACAVLVGELRAQPTFQPYGAWRGHIRYVQGPHRTKEKIHWGGGITPTGGAVLVQGLQSAQGVLTNSGGNDSQVRQSNAQHREAFDKQLNDLRSANQEILTQLNGVRDKLGLPKLTEAPVPAVTAGDAGGAQSGEKPPPGVLNDATAAYKAKQKVLEEFAKSMASNGAFAKRLTEAIAKGNSAKKKSPTDTNIERRLLLFKAVLTSFGVPLPPADSVSEATTEDFMAEAKTIIDELKTYSQEVVSYETLFTQIKPIGTIQPDVIEGTERNIKTAKDRIASWKLQELP